MKIVNNEEFIQLLGQYVSGSIKSDIIGKRDREGTNDGIKKIEGMIISDKHFSNCSFSHLFLQDCMLRSVSLYDCNIRHLTLINCKLQDCKFISCNMKGSIFSRCEIVKSSFAKSRLNNAMIFNNSITNLNLEAAILDATTFQNEIEELRVNHLKNIKLPNNSIVPEVGSFIAWKKAAPNVLLKVKIPEDALRLSTFGRKCRASKLEVLSAHDGKEIITTGSFHSLHNPNFYYTIGETAEADSFDPDRLTPCSNGLHFFVTRKEAEDFIY